jgi:hypothetical protein
VTAWACEFATIANDRELVVHLDQVLKYHEKAASLDFFWLTETLGIEPDEIYGAFWLEGNEPFVNRLYRRVYEDKGGKISIGEEDPMTIGMGRKEVPMKPPAEITAHNDRMHQLSLATGDAQWYTWKLLEGDLYLPLEHVGLQHLAGTSKQTGRKAKCYEFMVAFPAPVDLVDEIEAHTKALAEAIRETEERRTREMSRVYALHKLRNLLDLQIRHWEAKGVLDNVMEANALRDLDDEVRKLVDSSLDRLGELTGQNAAADGLLDYFDPAKKGAALEECLKTIAEHQHAYVPQFVDRLNDVLTDAVQVLGQSSRAMDFMRDHWMPLFEDACEHEPRLAKTIVDEIGDAHLKEFWSGGWRDDVGMLKQVLGRPKAGSALLPIVRWTQSAKVGLGLVSAAVSDAWVARLLSHFEKAARARSLSTTPRFLARAMLRYLACQAVAHTAAKEPALGSKGTLRRLLTRIRDSADYDAKAWHATGVKLNDEFGFSGRFRRAAPGIGLNLVAAQAMLFYALDAEDEVLWIRCVSFAGGLSSTASAGAALAEALEVQKNAGVVNGLAKALKFTGRGFNVATAAFSLVLCGAAVWKDYKRRDTYGLITNLVATTGATLSAAGAAFTVADGLFLSILTGWGVVVGGVVLVMVLLDPGDGPLELVEAYLRYARDGWPVKGDQHLGTVDSTLDLALRRAAFAKMDPAVGTPGKGLSDGEQPTVYAAHERGFEVQELRLMFWSPELALSLAGLIEAPYSDPITGDDG